MHKETHSNAPISVFDMFKIGVGPSSSHTLGPWRAAWQLIETLQEKKQLANIEQIQICLYGSLAKTGKGHGTDVAVMMGLMGEDPVTCDVDSIASKIEIIRKNKLLYLSESKCIDFDPERDILFLINESLKSKKANK